MYTVRGSGQNSLWNGSNLKTDGAALHWAPKCYLCDMEIHFPPEVETQLRQAASATGRNAVQLVRETVDRMLTGRARFVTGVQRGIEQADRGELVDHEDVRRRIERLFQP